MCTSDDLFQGKYCTVCKNRSRNEQIISLMYRMMLGTIGVVILFAIMGGMNFLQVLWTILIIMFAVFFFDGILRKRAYAGLHPVEKIGSSLHLYALNNDPVNLEVTIRALKKLKEPEKALVKKHIWDNLAMALTLGYNSLSDEFLEDFTNGLGITIKEAHQRIIEEAGDLIISAAINNASKGMMDFVLELYNSTKDAAFMKKLLKRIASVDINSFEAGEALNIFQEELFVTEDELIKAAKEVGVPDYQKVLKEKLDGYEPPEVPRTMAEELLRAQQELKQVRAPPQTGKTQNHGTTIDRQRD